MPDAEPGGLWRIAFPVPADEPDDRTLSEAEVERRIHERFLGNSLAARATRTPRRFHVFFSHYHFDHVEGLPLFQPLYDPQSRLTLYGFEAGGRSMRDVLEGLIRPPYFPVTLADVPARLDRAVSIEGLVDYWRGKVEPYFDLTWKPDDLVEVRPA